MGTLEGSNGYFQNAQSQEISRVPDSALLVADGQQPQGNARKLCLLSSVLSFLCWAAGWGGRGSGGLDVLQTSSSSLVCWSP